VLGTVRRIEVAAVAYVERSGRGWRARWSLGGGRFGSKSGFAGKRAAQQFAQEQELSARLWPRLHVEPGLTVGEWWHRWFPAQDLAPATLETYAQQYRRHVHPRFGHRALAEITGLELSDFARRLREAGLAPSSVTVVLSVIRNLLADAVSEGLIPTAPPLRLRHRRTGADTPVRPGIVVGVETVLAVCARLPRQEALMTLTALFTGMRWGEVCAMRQQYLHAPGGSGGARYLIDGKYGAVHEDVHARRFFGPPKGGAGRTIDLPGFLADLLTEHAASAGGRELLFANRRATAIRHTDFLTRWRPACDGTPLRATPGGTAPGPLPPICPGLRFHDLRHSHKNLLVELEVPDPPGRAPRTPPARHARRLRTRHPGHAHTDDRRTRTPLGRPGNAAVQKLNRARQTLCMISAQTARPGDSASTDARPIPLKPQVGATWRAQ
jgi:integrase